MKNAFLGLSICVFLWLYLSALVLIAGKNRAKLYGAYRDLDHMPLSSPPRKTLIRWGRFAWFACKLRWLAVIGGCLFMGTIIRLM